MKLLCNGWYRADEGKHFVLTELGKQNHATYSTKNVGEPVNEYDTEAVQWEIENGYLIETDIPDWIEKTGYKVVYDHNGYTLCAGNPIVFPELELAEKYMANYKQNPWMDHELYIQEAVYKGRVLKECRIYEGKKVYNTDWYYGTNALYIGDLVEKEIVDDLINALPPACMRSDCSQLGEAASHKIDDKGNCRATYVTFKEVAENTWEYCGECFRGENEPRGTEPVYA